MTDWDQAQRAMDELQRQARERWGDALLGSGIGHYVLDGHDVREVGLFAWARWFETADRRVAFDVLPDGTEVSTVFLGLDHNIWPQGPPLLFETMTFPAGENREDEQLQRRYATWAQAEAGHQEVLEEARRLELARRLVNG